MAAKKFLRLVSGRVTEVLGIVTSAGPANDGDIPALDATGRLSTTVMPIGVVADTKSLVCSENLTAGDLVNVWNDGGTPKARKADATTTGKEATGFVLSSYLSGETVLVYFEGVNNVLVGLTPGDLYYLDTTAGAITTTAPSANGNVVQLIGTALSTTELSFEPQTPITVVV